MVLWLIILGSIGFLLLLMYQRHRHQRLALYTRLALQRTAHGGPDMPGISKPATPLLATEFAAERLIRIANFLPEETLASLQAEAAAGRSQSERSYIPAYKQGGTLSYERMHTLAPRSLGLYHSEALRQWVSRVVETEVFPTCDYDQSSCVLLYYDHAGDHIGWHYDQNFYKGRRFTVLLAVHNSAADGGFSAGNLQHRQASGQVVSVDTSPNTLVLFEGARVRHCVTPVAPGDTRVMLSFTYCSNPQLGRFQEVTRRFKDVGLYGLRALWD
jgi:hypothetical protein